MEKKEEMKSGLLLDVIIQKGTVVLKLHTDVETKDKMESGLLLDVIIQKSVVIFELFIVYEAPLVSVLMKIQCRDKGGDEGWTPSGWYSPKECSHP